MYFNEHYLRYNSEPGFYKAYGWTKGTKWNKGQKMMKYWQILTIAFQMIKIPWKRLDSG